MAAIGEKELKAQIKTSDFSNVYFIYGEENYLKSYYVSELKKKIVEPAFADFNLHTYDGKDTALDDIINDAECLPMMSKYNLLIISDYPFDKNTSDCDKLKAFIKDVPDTTIIVFTFDTIEVDAKKNSKWKSLINACAKVGSAVELQKRTQSDLVRLIQNGAKKRGASISYENANYLLSVVGSDMTTVLNELEKLSMFVKDGEITKDIIDSMATKCLQARVYDLSKAVVKGDTSAAYSVLETLISIKTEPITILATLGGCYIDMYRVKCARTAAYEPTDVGKYYNYRGREFTLNNALRDGRNISMKALRNVLDEISEADIKLKSSPVSARVILEETIIKLLIIVANDKK